MPYRKTYKPKRSYLKTAASVASTALTALKVANQVKGMLNTEVHHHDTTQTITIDNAGSIISLCDIAQGDGSGDRTGNSIKLTSFLNRMSIIMHASSRVTLFRMILFRDNQQVADTEPTVANVLQTASWTSPLNELNVGRFQILKDQTFNLSDSGSQCRLVKDYKKLNLHVRFNGSAATDFQKGQLYWLMIGNEATNTPSIEYYSRLSYVDN